MKVTLVWNILSLISSTTQVYIERRTRNVEDFFVNIPYSTHSLTPVYLCLWIPTVHSFSSLNIHIFYFPLSLCTLSLTLSLCTTSQTSLWLCVPPILTSLCTPRLTSLCLFAPRVSLPFVPVYPQSHFPLSLYTRSLIVLPFVSVYPQSHFVSVYPKSNFPLSLYTRSLILLPFVSVYPQSHFVSVYPKSNFPLSMCAPQSHFPLSLCTPQSQYLLSQCTSHFPLSLSTRSLTSLCPCVPPVSLLFVSVYPKSNFRLTRISIPTEPYSVMSLNPFVTEVNYWRYFTPMSHVYEKHH